MVEQKAFQFSYKKGEHVEYMTKELEDFVECGINLSELFIPIFVAL